MRIKIFFDPVQSFGLYTIYKSERKYGNGGTDTGRGVQRGGRYGPA